MPVSDNAEDNYQYNGRLHVYLKEAKKNKGLFYMIPERVSFRSEVCTAFT